MTGPSLILVVLDTARKDLLSAPENRVFAQISSAGRSFSRAVAPAPWTLPSHASIFSGLRPSEHGITGAAVMTRQGPRSPKKLVEAFGGDWLPENLRRRGYATFAATANPWVGEAIGLTFGFEDVVESWRFASLPKLSNPFRNPGRGGRLRALGVYARRAAGAGDGGAMHSLEAFRRFLDSQRRPFFAFFNVMEPHAPYAPPRAHDTIGLGRRLPALRAVRRWNADRMIAFSMGREEIDPEDLSLLRELYVGEISYSDEWLGLLLETLETRGLAEETVLAVTSDHGENLGEHHRLSHILSMHEPILSVPLAVSGPFVPSGVENAPVSLAALPHMFRSLSDGSWWDPVRHPVVSEYESAAAQVSGARSVEDSVGDLAPGTRELLRTRWLAAYDENFKYVTSSLGAEHLYDLSSDPLESRDVSLENPERMERLRRFGGVWAGDGVTGEEGLEDEIIRHLEGLGYL